MRMARVNVYLPDELAERVKSADINVSAVAQRALESELRTTSFSAWLERVHALPPVAGDIDSASVIREAREDWEEHLQRRTEPEAP
jgi:post-segregation antitoxin (ccd killing protein)